MGQGAYLQIILLHIRLSRWMHHRDGVFAR